MELIRELFPDCKHFSVTFSISWPLKIFLKLLIFLIIISWNTSLPKADLQMFKASSCMLYNRNYNLENMVTDKLLCREYLENSSSMRYKSKTFCSFLLPSNQSSQNIFNYEANPESLMRCNWVRSQYQYHYIWIILSNKLVALSKLDFKLCNNIMLLGWYISSRTLTPFFFLKIDVKEKPRLKRSK